MPDTNNKPRRGSRILMFIGVAVLAALAVSIAVRAYATHRATPALTLGTIPFTDGETWQYTWSQAGNPVGSMAMTINAGTLDGKPIWEFNTEVRTGTDPAVKPVDVSKVTADAATLLPITTVASLDAADGHYDINITYSPKQAGYKAETPRGSQSGAAQLPGATYDNDESLMLIRALPLAEGYAANLVCLQPRNIVSYRVAVKVDGQEELTVGGDKIACWRVLMTVSGTTQKAWYATSPDHRLIRLDAANGTFELQPASAQAGVTAGPQPIN